MSARIAVIAPTPFFSDYGASVRIYNEVRCLEGAAQVDVFTYSAGLNPSLVTVSRVPFGPKSMRGGPHLGRLMLDPQLFLTTLRALRNAATRYDLLHCHLHEGGLIGVALSKFRQLKVVVDLQDSFAAELSLHGLLRENSSSLRMARAVESFVNNRADRILTSSTSLADFTRGLLNPPAERVSVLRDSIDTDNFKPQAADLRLRHALSLPSNVKVIVYLGSLSRIQGTDFLLQAIARLSKKRNDFHLLVIGYPSHHPYTARASALGIAGHVSFVGPISYFGEAPRYLAQADVAVSPKFSTLESNGKLIAYMAMGLPSLVFDNEVNRELAGDSALFSPEGDLEAFVDRLGDLLDNGDVRRRLGEKGRVRAVEKFSLVSMRSNLLKAYGSLGMELA